MKKSLKELNLNVPRYTSYPVITDWKGDHFKIQRSSLKSSFHKFLDIYIHIPFCETLCYYCGCNRVLSKNKDRAQTYVHYLKKEWELYLKELSDFSISSIHLGGGTPNFLTPKALDDLLQVFDSYKNEEFVGNIEIDPRTFELKHLEVLKKHNFKSASLGIQDFSQNVQRKINRIQPFELVETVVSNLRANHFTQLNFDLIYGLPAQDLKTIEQTFSKVLKLKPERISFFSYAHLPQKIKNQRLIDDKEILTGDAKKELFLLGEKMLLSSGYMSIGMDHYALPESDLYKAKQKGKLHRNFMGYVSKKSDHLIGLGVSAISQSTKGFTQNEKKLNNYYDKIDKGIFPIFHGHNLTSEESFISEIIQQIFCYGQIKKDELNHLKNKSELILKLNTFQSLGLIDSEFHYKSKHILDDYSEYFKLSDRGKPYIRVIASIFDQYRKNDKNFSQAI